MVKDCELYRRNAEEKHPLHFQVAELFDELSNERGYSLRRDGDCGGCQRIPLFSSRDKSRKTWFCDVDLLVIKDGAVKAIIEIEESDVRPMQVFGKFLASAVSRFYIHESRGEVMELSGDMVFIQFVDNSKLKLATSSKKIQWKNIGDSIRSVVPLKGSKITRYELVDINVEDFKTDKRKELKNLILELIG